MWNYYEKLELRRFSSVSQFTIPDMPGTSPNPAWNNTDTKASQTNYTGGTPDGSYLLISCTSFSSSSPSFSFSSTTLPSLQNIKLSHPSLSRYVMIMSWHWVQHTPSTCIRWIQHPPRTVCLPFIFMITSWPLNIPSASNVHPYTIHRHQPALHGSSMVMSHCHIPTVPT